MKIYHIKGESFVVLEQYGKPSPPYTAWQKGKCDVDFTGLPEKIQFKTIGSYGEKTLKLLLENEDTLGFAVKWR